MYEVLLKSGPDGGEYLELVFWVMTTCSLLLDWTRMAGVIGQATI